MLDWLVVGGGLHGTALSYHLTKHRGIPADRIRVLDPYETPLTLWKHHTVNTGMAYLRSPLVHHLHPDVWSLRTFAATQNGQPLARFIPQHARPSLELFNAHTQQLIERAKLDHLRLQGRAKALVKIAGGWRVETENGGLDAKRVLLAIGATEQPFWPEWAEKLKQANASINHIFDPQFQRENLQIPQHTVVIGGGITAAQTALTLSDEQPGSVTLFSRHALRIAHYDSDPCWVTSICLKDFHAETDFNRRRAMIKAARYRGSLPPDVANELNQAVDAGKLRLCFGEIDAAQQTTDGHITLKLSDDTTLTADQIILATGFRPERPGGAWLDAAVETYALPTANCGYPIVDKSLMWTEGLYVSGPLAELEVGPTARNIIGARLAGERLAKLT